MTTDDPDALRRVNRELRELIDAAARRQLDAEVERLARSLGYADHHLAGLPEVLKLQLRQRVLRAKLDSVKISRPEGQETLTPRADDPFK